MKHQICSIICVRAQGFVLPGCSDETQRDGSTVKLRFASNKTLNTCLFDSYDEGVCGYGLAVFTIRLQSLLRSLRV